MKTKRTLKEIYQVVREGNQWKYYEHSTCPTIEELFNSNHTSTDWVKTMFRDGEKLCVFNGFTNEVLLCDRMKHTISVYFLGIFIVNQIHPMKERINTYVTSKGIEKWTYFWFLICLYHDYGYIVENDKDTYVPNLLDLDKLCQRLNVNSEVLSIIHYDNSALATEDIINYFEFYRSQKQPFLNHGIIGGILLYHELTKNLDNIISQKKQQEEIFDDTNFAHNGLHYSINHKDWYQICAESIILHNIWFAHNKKDITFNIQNGLTKFCLRRDEKLWYNNPLTNLLMLCDTLEPIKLIGTTALTEVRLNANNNKIRITMPKRMLDNEMSRYKENMVSLKKWFKIHSRVYNGKNNFTITFTINP